MSNAYILRQNSDCELHSMQVVSEYWELVCGAKARSPSGYRKQWLFQYKFDLWIEAV